MPQDRGRIGAGVAWAMRDEPGVYQLRLHLPWAARVRVGKLGTFLFPAGRYIYTGSALGGLERRLARHRRSQKKLNWHIDYLLRVARIEDVTQWPTCERRVARRSYTVSLKSPSKSRFRISNRRYNSFSDNMTSGCT